MKNSLSKLEILLLKMLNSQVKTKLYKTRFKPLMVKLLTLKELTLTLMHKFNLLVNKINN